MLCYCDRLYFGYGQLHSELLHHYKFVVHSRKTLCRNYYSSGCSSKHSGDDGHDDDDGGDDDGDDHSRKDPNMDSNMG